MPMNARQITRCLAISTFAGVVLAISGCGGSAPAAPVDVKEGAGTPTLFDNPPLGDPLAPSQAELNARRPPRKVVRPAR